MQVKEKGKTEKNDKIFRAAIIFAAAVIIIVLVILLLRGCNGDKQGNVPNTPSVSDTGIRYDPGAVIGGWDQADLDDIVAGLNKKVEEGMINISMNTSPYFEYGYSEGNLMIVNEGINRYPQVVEIIRNDTKETIYKSGAIPVGSKIENAKLDTVLGKGAYESTALFYNVDPETGSYLGCAGAIILLTVLN
jgi:hypothetical protein